MTKIRYLRTRDRGDFPAEYTIRAFERALSNAGLDYAANEPSEAITLLGKVLSRVGLIRNIASISGQAFFVPLMGPTERRFWPTSYLFEVIPYCYDCWPKDYERWEAILTRNKTRLAFFSAEQSADFFARKLPQMESIWLPEATDSAEYTHDKLLGNRRIDVLEMGRRYRTYHAMIRRPLRDDNVVHLFEPIPGAVVFQKHRDFLTGLADTKISICFPSSLTHPRRSGAVETLTHRYLESIASKCVLLGRCPRELEVLFGYNPVIEADMTNAAGQLRAILENIDTFQDQVERNYRRLLEVGTWEVRVTTLLGMLTERGYTVEARRLPALDPA